MKKYYQNFSFLLLSFAIFSCGKDDTSEPIEELVVLPVSISDLSKTIIKQGEFLEIEGTNFIQDTIATYLEINGSSYAVIPISNTKISLEIIDEMGIEESTVTVNILGKRSAVKPFYILPLGWYQINKHESLDIMKSYIFDDTDDIISLVDGSTNSNFFGVLTKLIANQNGYKSTNINGVAGNQTDLVMYNKNIGASATISTGFFTTNGFESSTSFGDFLGEGEAVIDTRILDIDESSCILTNLFGAHIYTDDSGLTSSYDDSPSFLTEKVDNGITFHGEILSYGKSTNRKIYELAYSYEEPRHNIILSSNSYNNWEVVDSTMVYDSKLRKAKFININKILTLDGDSNLLYSNNLGLSWVQIRANVSSFFLKSETVWYIVSDDMLNVSEDSGQTWNLELELPENSVVNHMFFSESKLLLSGNKGLLFVKH